MYAEEICTPMRKELTDAGFEEMKTAEDVDDLFNNHLSGNHSIQLL